MLPLLSHLIVVNEKSGSERDGHFPHVKDPTGVGCEKQGIPIAGENDLDTRMLGC